MLATDGREAKMADPVFLARVLAASLVAAALSLGAINGWGEPSTADKPANRIVVGH
jgi:hypothetical protein